MAKYSRVSLKVEAIQWLGDVDNHLENLEQVKEFLDECKIYTRINTCFDREFNTYKTVILYIEDKSKGLTLVAPKTYIIKIDDTIEYCSSEIFEKNYRPI